VIEIGVDIGGTFTDVVLLKDGDTLVNVKVPTTPTDLIDAVEDGVRAILQKAGCKPRDVARFIHGSTVAINALLERKGATTGILMTAGFEDTLEIGRHKRSRMYDLHLKPETPTFLAPRRRRIGVSERIGPDGSVSVPLDEKQVIEAVGALVRDHGVTAIAICYLFSFRNPAHEQRTRDLIKAAYPELEVSISSEVDPTFREYERLVVTTLETYLRGTVGSYVSRLAQSLKAMGFEAGLQVMQSRGGITGAETIAERPVSLLLSGLAAGVVGSRFVAAAAGFEDIVSLDIGGTSCDIAMIRAGKPLLTNFTLLEQLPLRQQMIDVSTIGAGGGSIAWLDDVGGLRVGPQSMGSDPGPACYGRGGREATVTDASLVLGFLNPARFAGGGFALDRAAAEAAVDRLAERIGLARAETAAGIHRILNARMADEIRRATVQRGADPRDFSLLALGGAGPVHAGALARELNIARLVIPETPGVLSAFGLLVGAIEHEQSETLAARADELTPAGFRKAIDRLGARCAELMRRDGVGSASVEAGVFADMRYVGQSYELTVPVPVDGPEPIAAAVAAFHDQHRGLYGHADGAAAVEFVNLRVVHTHALPTPTLTWTPSGDTADGKASESRAVYFTEFGKYVETPIFDRLQLQPDQSVDGPAIVEQADTTLVLYPGQHAHVHPSGSIIVERARP
jgi:N-methylhydantoinase A